MIVQLRGASTIQSTDARKHLSVCWRCCKAVFLLQHMTSNFVILSVSYLSLLWLNSIDNLRNYLKSELFSKAELVHISGSPRFPESTMNSQYKVQKCTSAKSWSKVCNIQRFFWSTFSIIFWILRHIDWYFLTKASATANCFAVFFLNRTH